MMTPAREIQPAPGLEERVVSALVAAGLVRRRRVWPVWVAAAAAVIVLVGGVTLLQPTRWLKPGHSYVLLLYEDSTYRPAPAGHNEERVAVLSRWADSLSTFGEFERAGHLIGLGEAGLGGVFLIRATDDADAARIAASCPFTQWGGHIEVRRFER